MTEQETINGLKHLFSEYELDLPCTDSLNIEIMAINALEEAQKYREIKKRLKNVYGECPDMLELVVDQLEKHDGVDIPEPVFKSRLLTDGMVDVWEAYKAIGTVDEIKSNIEELKRWHTDKKNMKIRNVFANTSTLICHNCDHKDEYIEELEAEIEEYRALGTPEECRAAVEKQKEMIAYCEENDCADCPYHGGNQEENRCMNDFIADEIAEQLKGGGADAGGI